MRALLREGFAGLWWVFNPCMDPWAKEQMEIRGAQNREPQPAWHGWWGLSHRSIVLFLTGFLVWMRKAIVLI